MNRGYQQFQDEAQYNPQMAGGPKRNLGDIQQRIHDTHEQQQNVFEEDRIPPNFDHALLHQKAWKVGYEVELQKGKRTERCPCCARVAERKPLKLSCDPSSLSFLGSGFPLFFDFCKYCIIILLILFVTSGDYNIITNIAYGNDCEYSTDSSQVSNKNFCVLNWITRASLANKRNDGTLVNIQQMLNLVSILVIIVILQYFRKGQRETDLECDSKTLSASDYTVLIKNIPIRNDEKEGKILHQLLSDYLDRNFPVSEEIIKAEEIRRRLNPNNPKRDPNSKTDLPRIVTVNLCYNITERKELKNKKDGYIQKKQQILTDLYREGLSWDDPSLMMNQNREYSNERLNQVQKEINIIDQNIEELEERFHQKQDVAKYFLGMAFVTFQWQIDKEAFLEKNVTNAWTRFFGGTSDLKFEEVYGQDSYLIVEDAPDPTDVYWDNLHISTRQKTIKRAVGFATISLVLLVCFVVIYKLSSIQAQTLIEQQKYQQKGNISHVYKVKFIAFLASLTIIFINYALSYIIKNIAAYEGFSTYTGYNENVATFSAFAQFANTALITFFINTLVLKNTFGSGGLIYNQTYVFISNALIPSVLEAVDIWGLVKKYKRGRQINLKENCTMTQIQLNKLFEDPEQDMAARYATILKTMFLTAFYASIIPIGIIISCGGLLFTYWVQKYNILRRRTIKFSFSSRLSIEMTENLELVLPIYCFTNFWFEYQFSGGAQISSFACIGIAIGILNAVLPMQDFNVALFPLREKISEHKPYKENEFEFESDFPRENPCTQRRALDYFKKQQALQLEKSKQY